MRTRSNASASSFGASGVGGRRSRAQTGGAIHEPTPADSNASGTGSK